VQHVSAFILHDSLEARTQEGLQMTVKRSLFVLAFTVLCAAPALAKPTVIAELGTAPLLGTSRSTAEMRALIARNEGLMSAAAVRLGLTTGEYAQFNAAIADSHVAWVTVPRHLDAMTWQADGHVYAIHNVIIPKHTNGWEVDVAAHGAVLALYMPAKCGNLSLVRRPARVLARRTVKPVPIAAVAAPAAPVAPVETAYVPPAPPPDDAPVPVAAPATEFPPAAVSAGKPKLLFLAPLLFGLAALSGGSGSGPIAAPPAGCP
jgi:hypothetical protein